MSTLIGRYISFGTIVRIACSMQEMYFKEHDLFNIQYSLFTRQTYYCKNSMLHARDVYQRA